MRVHGPLLREPGPALVALVGLLAGVDHHVAPHPEGVARSVVAVAALEVLLAGVGQQDVPLQFRGLHAEISFSCGVCVRK